MAAWNPETPMENGNMTPLVTEIEEFMESSGKKTFTAIRAVLESKIGADKFAALANENVANGSNDQKRLVLKVLQVFKRMNKKRKRETALSSNGNATANYADTTTLSSVGNATANYALQPLFGSSSTVANPCKRCGEREIDMVNMPCGCNTYCSTCARYAVEHHQRCIECRRHVRHVRTSDSRFEVQCSACGFIWDGNAQHMCDATERVIRLPASLPALASNGDLPPHPIDINKVNKVLLSTLREYADPEDIVIGGPIFAEYRFQLRDDWFDAHILDIRKRAGLKITEDNRPNFDDDDGFADRIVYRVSVSTSSRRNINGRYGPDKDRIIRIPDYQRSVLHDDWDQQKVYRATRFISIFNWVLNGLSREYLTTLSKVPDHVFEGYKQQLQSLKLKLVSLRETYFEHIYILVPKSSASIYRRTAYV